MSSTISQIVTLCTGPLLAFVPLALIIGWARAYTAPPSAGINDGHHRWLVGVLVLLITGLLALRVVSAGLVQAIWIVAAHPLWMVIGIAGFVNLLVYPLENQERQHASMILSGIALVLWLVIVGLYLLNSPDVVIQSFGSLSRTTPINVTVGIGFGIASLFLFKPDVKDRQMSIVTLLTLALAIGGLLVVLSEAG